MRQNFVQQFQDLAESFREPCADVPEEALRVLVWETFKAYAGSLDPLELRLDETVKLMKRHGVEFDRDYVQRLRADLGEG
jgi:hypothetical protein